MAAAISTRGDRPAHHATILLVEDDAMVREVVADLLEDAGYRVVQAADAGEAIRLIEGNGFDLVFSDVRMPGEMDGIGLTHWIRRRHPELRVMLMSGYVDPRALSGAAKADDFVQKPYAAADVLRRLEALIR